MKRKLSAFLFVIILCFGTAISAFATETDGITDQYNRVIDMADLLTDSEEAALTLKLDEISTRQNMDVVVATTNDSEGCSVMEYADLLYETCKFGYGDGHDGLLLLISMEDHDWYISTCGYGFTAFTDAGIEYIGNKIKSDLSDGNYAAAFSSYADLCDDFITQARTDKPYDSGNLPREPLSLIWIPIALVIGFVIAQIVVGSMKSKLKTVRKQAAANSYMKNGSMNITDSRDLYLYRTVTRVKKADESANNSSGSSTHASSSGTTHGGGGGKF